MLKNTAKYKDFIEEFETYQLLNKPSIIENSEESNLFNMGASINLDMVAISDPFSNVNIDYESNIYSGEIDVWNF